MNTELTMHRVTKITVHKEIIYHEDSVGYFATKSIVIETEGEEPLKITMFANDPKALKPVVNE